MSYLVQILLPLADNDNIRFPDDVFRPVQAELAGRFGGLTAYSRAPAQGLWMQRGRRQADDIVILEVMTEALEEEWWRGFRQRLEKLFRQDRVVVRAQEIRNL